MKHPPRLITYIFTLIYVFAYQKPLKLTFQTIFEYQINFRICLLKLWIHNGYFVFKKLVWNVRIKSFWFTKIIKVSLLWNIIFFFYIINENFSLVYNSCYSFLCSTLSLWKCISTAYLWHLWRSWHRFF